MKSSRSAFAEAERVPVGRLSSIIKLQGIASYDPVDPSRVRRNLEDIRAVPSSECRQEKERFWEQLGVPIDMAVPARLPGLAPFRPGGVRASPSREARRPRQGERPSPTRSPVRKRSATSGSGSTCSRSRSRRRSKRSAAKHSPSRSRSRSKRSRSTRSSSSSKRRTKKRSPSGKTKKKRKRNDSEGKRRASSTSKSRKATGRKEAGAEKRRGRKGKDSDEKGRRSSSGKRRRSPSSAGRHREGDGERLHETNGERREREKAKDPPKKSRRRDDKVPEEEVDFLDLDVEKLIATGKTVQSNSKRQRQDTASYRATIGGAQDEYLNAMKKRAQYADVNGYAFGDKTVKVAVKK